MATLLDNMKKRCKDLMQCNHTLEAHNSPFMGHGHGGPSPFPSTLYLKMLEEDR